MEKWFLALERLIYWCRHMFVTVKSCHASIQAFVTCIKKRVIDCLDFYFYFSSPLNELHTQTHLDFFLLMRMNGKSSLQLNDTDNAIISKMIFLFCLVHFWNNFSCVKIFSTTCHFRLLATLNQVKREMHHKIALKSKRKIKGDISWACFRFLVLSRLYPLSKERGKKT